MSELKYLLRKKSNNSVLINRENVSTDLLQKNLTLLANSKYWHAFVIHNVRNLNKYDILKTVLDYIFPLDLIPVHFQSIGTVCMFLARNCADAILKLCKDGLLIPHPTKVTSLYPCEIILQYATVETLKHDVQKNVSGVLSSLFNEDNKTLNLEKFSSNLELTEYSPLSQPKILYFVLHLSKELKPTCIKLNNNEIRSLFPLDALSGVEAVKELDLRNNLITDISELKILKVLDLVELWLDGNPLCNNYEEMTYISAIREILPLLEKLDGVPLRKKGEMIFERNYLCSMDGFDVVGQFVEHFFQMYDWNRKLLVDLYHPNGVFSITSIFKRGLVTSGTAKLDAYEAIGRNLLSVKNFNKNRDVLIKGNVEIVKKLERLPKTRHNALSFCIDLIYYTNTLAAIAITGTFREVAEKPMEPERLLGFNRMFVIGRSGDRFFIHNDLFHVYNALNHQVSRAFTQEEDNKNALVASTAKEKEKAVEAILLVTGMNREWSKRLLEDADYELPRFFKTFMDLLKIDKVPEKAFKISKGGDKDAFLKWMVTEALQFGVHKFKESLREEILEYLAEHPSLLVSPDLSISKLTACDPKDAEKLDEELWLQKYENLTVNVDKKQAELKTIHSPNIISHKNITSDENNTFKNKTTSINSKANQNFSIHVGEEKSKSPRQSSTSYDNVPMELSDDDETNKTADVSQSIELVAPTSLYIPEQLIHNQPNQYQVPPRDMIVHYGLNNMQVDTNQTVSTSPYVRYEHISLNTQHPNNPNVIVSNNIQPSLNMSMLPPVAPASVFLPPIPQKESLPEPKKNSAKEEEILKLEELKKKKVIQINLLFNKFKSQQAARALDLPVKKSLGNAHEVSSFPSVSGNFTPLIVPYAMDNTATAMSPVTHSAAMVPMLPLVPTYPEAYGMAKSVVVTNENISQNNESRKSWYEKNARKNLIDVSKIQAVKSKCVEKESGESEKTLSQGKHDGTIPLAEHTTADSTSCSKESNSLGAEHTTADSTSCSKQSDSLGATETDSLAPRNPTITLTYDNNIPPRIYKAKKLMGKERKQLHWRPPALTLLSGKWTYIDQNENRAFRIIYGKWILMQKNDIGKWQELQDDFIKSYSCWRKHFPSYPNEPLNHVLSSSCLKSFVKTTFDSIPDPVTYWDFPSSVPHDIRPPQLRSLNVKGKTYQIYVTPESGFGFISVQGKWVLLAQNERNQWAIMGEKEKNIAWLDGKWRCNAFPRIVSPAQEIPEEKYMPALGLFSNQWIAVPTPTLIFKFLFGYWVLFRKNDFGRWNVARDDFANAFTCKKKHFPGDRESVPNPKMGVWKPPINFHTAQSTCLPSFDKKIFDSIGFPVTTYHFLPTVPKDLRPPKSYLLLDPEVNGYVEKDITPDSNFGFVSVNGHWEIREKTEGGTWIPVGTKYPEAPAQSVPETENTSWYFRFPVPCTVQNEEKLVEDTSKEIVGTNASPEAESQPIAESTSPDVCNHKPRTTRWNGGVIASNKRKRDSEDLENKTDGFSSDPPALTDQIISPAETCSNPTDSLIGSNQTSQGSNVNTEPSAKVQRDEHNLESLSLESQSITSKVVENEVKLDEIKISDEAKALNRLKTLNAWKKTFQLIPSIPKLTMLDGKWIIISDQSRLRFQQFDIITWLLLELNSDGRWKIIKDDFTLARERSADPNNLEEYMSLIGKNKFDSIPIPVTHSDFPSSVPNKLRPPLVIEYEEQRIEVNANSGYACLSIKGNWILLKQNDEGSWVSVDDKYQTDVKEILKNTPEKYLSNSKKRKINSADYVQKLSTTVCPFLELITGNVPGTVVKPVTHWDIDGKEEERPPKFALIEIDGKKQWSGIRPNGELGFVLEDDVWVLMKKTEFNEWNHCGISCYEGCIVGYFLLNNRWMIMKKYILGGKWEPVYDYKLTPSTYWDFIGPEEEKPPRNVLFSSHKKSKNIHKNSGMGFLKKDDTWILMENKNDKWFPVKDAGNKCIYKLIEGMWATMKKNSEGNFTPQPIACPKLITYWNFNGLPNCAPPKRIIMEENGSKSSKIIDEKSGMGFILDEGVWVLVKEGENGEPVLVNHSEKGAGKVGFEVKNGKCKIISKDESGKWVRSADTPSNTSKSPRTPEQLSIEDKFNNPIPLTYYDIPSHIPERLRPPKYGLIATKQWRCIRSNSGYGFIFENGMWRLMKWVFGSGWLLLEDIVDVMTLGYKAIDGRWVPMKKEENNEWIPLFDPYSTPRVIGQCYGPAEDKPPSRVPIDGTNIIDVTFETKFGFVKKSNVWILMKQQEDNTWKRFEYAKDQVGTYGYKRVQDNFNLMQKHEDGNWLRVYWDWDADMWTHRMYKCPKGIYLNSHSKKKSREDLAIFTQENIVDMIYTSESYINSLTNEQRDDFGAPQSIETGVYGTLECIEAKKSNGVSFMRKDNIWILLALDYDGWYTPNDCLGYELIDYRWVLMRKDTTGSWLPTFDPIHTPRSFWNTVGSGRPPKRVTVFINGITKWMDVGSDINVGFIKNGEIFILVKRNYGDWEIMTDDLEESSTLAFKVVDYRWRRMKKNELGEWISCSTEILLPIQSIDIIGPKSLSPPSYFHIIDEYNKLKSCNYSSISNVGFEQQDGIWVVMQCRQDYTWWRHPDSYNNEVMYGYEYNNANSKYTLMKKEKEDGKWMPRNPKKQISQMETCSQTLMSVDIENINSCEIEKKRSYRKKHKGTPREFKYFYNVPRYERPPESLLLDVDGVPKRVWFSQETKYGFKREYKVWILYERDKHIGWKVVQNTVDGLLGHKLMNKRFIVMRRNEDGSWVSTCNPGSTPRTFYDTVGPKCERPPLRVVLKQNGSFRWQIVSEENGLGFMKEKNMWILFQRKSAETWAKFTEDSKKDEFGFRIVDGAWAKFKRYRNGVWASCSEASLPLLNCDFPVKQHITMPRKLYFTSYLNQINENELCGPDSNFGFQLDGGAWILMKCDENGTWSKFNLFPDQEGTFGYMLRQNSWEIVKKDNNDQWSILTKKKDLNGIYIDFNDEKSDEPPAKKCRLRPELAESETKTKAETFSNVSIPKQLKDNSNAANFQNIVSSAETKEETSNVSIPKQLIENFNANHLSSKETKEKTFSKVSITKQVREDSNALYFQNLLSTKKPINFEQFRYEKGENRPPHIIVINENGTQRRISLKRNKIDVAFLEDNGVWIAVKKHEGGWKTIQSDADELLGYKVIDNRWVILKKIGNEWEPTFDPISTPRNHLDTVGSLDEKPPIRIVVSEDGIDKWKVALEENGFGFIKQENVWVVMSKLGGSWKEVKESSDEMIGYQIINSKWTKVRKGKDGVWKTCSVSLPCLHWDYVCRNETTPPKLLPVQSVPSENMKCEIIRIDSGKGFDMEDGVWILKQCKAGGTWEKVDILPGFQGSHGIVYNQGWKVVKKVNGKWVEIIGFSSEEGRPNVREDTDKGIQVKSVECCQSKVHVPFPNQTNSKLFKDASGEEIHIDAQFSGKKEEGSFATSSKEAIMVNTPVTYHEFRNASYEKRPPQSVLINLDGKLERILLSQKNTHMAFQKQDDVWILVEKQDNVWRTVQNSDDGLLGYKLVDNRWVVMRKQNENEWVPTFDSATTPRSFFDTVGQRETRPPIRVVINKNGVDKWQIISEENGFGFIRQEGIWVLMKKQGDKLWIEYEDGPSHEILGYNLINCQWTKFKKTENGVWNCIPQVSLPVLHWDFVNGDQLAPPHFMCNCCEGQNDDIGACLGSGKGFQFEEGAWVPMKCADDGSWSQFDIFPRQQGSFGYMNIEDCWKIVKRDTKGIWRVVPENDEGMCVSKDFDKNNDNKKTPMSSPKSEPSAGYDSLKSLQPTDNNFPDIKSQLKQKLSNMDLDADKISKPEELLKENTNLSSSENSNLDDLLPSTINCLQTLPPKKVEPVAATTEDGEISVSSESTSINLKIKAACVKNEPPLNSVEVYLAANPNYELSCPELQNLLRECRPKDKPNKLLRKRFRLPDGKTVLLTIPKGLTELSIDNLDSNRQKLNEVEKYLATHPPSEWTSPEFRKILCEFEANDLNVSKRLCRYDFLFPDGVKRPLPIPKKTDKKNKAAEVLASEIKNILKNYKDSSIGKVETKRKMIEDCDSSKKVKKMKV